MHNGVLVLQLALDQKKPAVRHQQPLSLIQIMRNNHIRDAGLVFPGLVFHG